MRLRLLLSGLLLVAAAGCGGAAAPAATSAASPSATPVSVGAVRSGGLPVGSASGHRVQAQPAAGSCRARGGGELSLPDPGCTPGASNPAVTQATIESTSCVAGYSASLRPSVSVTDREKRASMAAYGDPDTPGLFEYDHLVSLELGGAANDPRNLWPEPGSSPNPKDRLEDALHDLVCAHQLSLVRAQELIAGNWVTAYRHVLGTPAPVNATAAAVAAVTGGRAARSSGGGSVAATAVPSTAAAPTAGGGETVTPGEYCAAPGATGASATGRGYVCRADSTGRDRWRRPL